MSENEKLWHDHEKVFEEYRQGVDYKTALGRLGMYEQNRINQRFFLGDQWHGAQCGDQRPLVRLNVIQRVGEFKMAVAGGGPVAVLYTAEGVTTDAASTERVSQGKKALRTGDAMMLSADEEIQLAMSAMTDYFKVTAERVKFTDLKALCLQQAFITGTGVLYTYWDDSIRTGQFADQARTEPIRGDIRCEVLDIENVYYGDTAEPDIQNQPYIIIAQRCRVEDVKREARRNRRPQEEQDAIKPDKDSAYMAGEVQTREPEGERKITVLTKLTKVYDKETDEYTIHAVRVVKGATIRREWDTKLRRYPLAKIDWKQERGCAYGVSEATYLIPNQIAINRTITSAAHAVSMIGMPITVVNTDVVTEPVTNDPGQIIHVAGADDLSNAIHYEIPPNFSPQFDNLVNSLITNTLSTNGANDAALGNMRPDNTSAILAVREQAMMPLQMLSERVNSFVEDVARIWVEYWVCWYAQRKLKMEDEDGVWYMPFDGSKYHDLLINVRVDVGPANLWSEIQQLMTLDNVMGMGLLTPVEYLENLPKGSIPNQEKILQGLKDKQTPATPPPTEGNGEGEDVGQTLNQLPPEYKEKIAGMSPEQRAMLAQSMAGI